MAFDIGQGLFDAWFDFSRPTAADYRNAAGETVEAAIDAPRFDHLVDGTSIGLVVEPGAELGQADRARLQLDAIGATDATVLHARREDDGTIVRRAWYSRNPQATVDACLGQAGHHLAVGVVPGYRPNVAGYVWMRGLAWQLTDLLGTGIEGEALGDDHGRPLIGG